jgi:hypothetical protein
VAGAFPFSRKEIVMHPSVNPHSLPVLGGIAGVLRWLEELALISSGPLLVFGLGVALVALLTDGQLLVQQPWLLYAWAVAQAVGCDALLLGSSYNVGHSLRSRRYVAAVGYGVLVGALAYVGYVAALVFATSESSGVSTADALRSLGLDGTTWIVQRSALSVGLVVLSGLLRYVAPPKAMPDIALEREQLERELALEPLRAQARAQKATGWRAVGAALVKSSTFEDFPPTGPGTPVKFSAQEENIAAQEKNIAAQDANFRLMSSELPPTRLRAVTAPRKASARRKRDTRNARSTAGVRTASVEGRVRAAWSGPDMTVGQLQSAAGIGRSTASKWRKVLLAESSEMAV